MVASSVVVVVISPVDAVRIPVVVDGVTVVDEVGAVADVVVCAEADVVLDATFVVVG